jgi:DNA-binding transcriptional ArsR family regulator
MPPSSGDPLSTEAADLIAARLRVIAEPMRIRLIDALNEGAATRQSLRARLGTSPQTVSKHLGILHQAGIVSRRRDGGRIEYSLSDWTGLWMVRRVAESIAVHLDGQREILAPLGRDDLTSRGTT